MGDMSAPATPSVFFHYTTPECLQQIQSQRMIMPFLPPPSVPSIFYGLDLRDTPTIFLTRMDPSNPKESIAFNNYSGAWRYK